MASIANLFTETVNLSIDTQKFRIKDIKLFSGQPYNLITLLIASSLFTVLNFIGETWLLLLFSS